jgi:hypothetical protein
MPIYRFYSVSSDGHIAAPPVVAEFPDDRAAIEAAKDLLNEKAIEVWEGPRVVIRLAPKRD